LLVSNQNEKNLVIINRTTDCDDSVRVDVAILHETPTMIDRFIVPKK
jgi:hypothetical protein